MNNDIHKQNTYIVIQLVSRLNNEKLQTAFAARMNFCKKSELISL